MEGRSKRACTARAEAKAKVPSSSHYVGYVEDDETPEAIMKKFEALERLQQQHTASRAEATAGEAPEAGPAVEDGEAQGLTEEQLLEVFKQTSVFSVRNMQAQDGMEDEFFRSDDECYEDDFEAAGHEDEEGAGAADRKRRPAARGAPSVREPKAQKHILTAYNRDNQMLMRRKKVVDPYELLLIKLPPPPLPTSWGRMVKPYQPPAAQALALKAVPDSVQVEHAELSTKELAQLGTAFLGVLLNPPWGGALTPSHLAALQLEKLCPLGFVFVWVEKEVLSDVVDVFVKAQFVYVENLTWVHMAPNNRVVEGKTAFTGRSHRTLLIFRRDVRKFEAAKKIELRHQRNPDVDICVVNTGADGRLLTPESAYIAIETLLPGGYSAGKPGLFLELWAHAEIRRPGWTHVMCP